LVVVFLVVVFFAADFVAVFFAAAVDLAAVFFAAGVFFAAVFVAVLVDFAAAFFAVVVDLAAVFFAAVVDLAAVFFAAVVDLVTTRFAGATEPSGAIEARAGALVTGAFAGVRRRVAVASLASAVVSVAADPALAVAIDAAFGATTVTSASSDAEARAGVTDGGGNTAPEPGTAKSGAAERR
jgi:hypothetical protein